MASQWQGVRASGHRRSLLKEEQLQEAMPCPARPPEASTGALSSLCRQFQRRLPLRTVSLNLGAGPSWQRLETPAPEQQGLQAAARSAKNALGAMSQRIQESYQSSTRWLMGSQVKARVKRGARKGSRSPALSLSQKSPRRHGTAPGSKQRERPRPPAQPGPRTHPRRRQRGGTAIRSPRSSAEPLCSPSESDSDLELVGAGLQHLQKLSRTLDKAIVAEESGDLTVSLIRD